MIGRNARLVVLSLVGYAVLAPAASASTAYVSEAGQLVVLANAGEQNYVTVNDPGVTIEVGDTAGITAGAGCEQQSAISVRCPGFQPVGIGRTLITLGDGDDFYHEQSELFKDDVDAGTGNDEVHSDREDDVVVGGDGNDKLFAGGGDDQVNGGDGDDTVIGSSGDDRVIGGSGSDNLDGDRDGTSDGNDVIEAQDGEKDYISCDNGADRVTADRIDQVEVALCEEVVYDGGPEPVDGPQVSASVKRSMSLDTFLSKGFAFTATADRAVAFAAALFVPAKAARRLGLGKKTVRIAQGSGTLGPGTAQGTLTKRFKKSRLRALLREGGPPIPVVFQALARDADGNEVTIKRKSKLRR